MSDYDYGTPTPDSYGPPSRSSLGQRVLGIISFKEPIYREIATDPDATAMAGVIVAGMGLVIGFAGGLSVPAAFADPQVAQIYAQIGVDTAALSSINPLLLGAVGGAAQVVFGLLGWVIISALTAFTASKFFSGELTTGQMMRVYGFSSLFGLVSLVPFVGGLAAFVLQIVAGVIGVRAATKLETGGAIGAVLVAYLFIFLLLMTPICVLIVAIAALASGGV